MHNIFKRLVEENRVWDYFEDGNHYIDVSDEGVRTLHSCCEHSLADLITNKTWCIAVWGKHWKERSQVVFEILRDEGNLKDAISFIEATMI